MADEQKTIHSILRSPDGQEYVLVLVETRPWDEAGVLDNMEDLINRCVGFVLDGHLAAQFPESAGRSVRIHVGYEVPPDEAAQALFARVSVALERHGIELSVEPLGPEEADTAAQPEQRSGRWWKRRKGR
jgi:hypothetical protein